MASYAALLGRKFGTVCLTALLLSIVVFIVLRIIPSDPLAMMLPPSATQADIDFIRKELGLDGSIFQQYLVWLGNALQGDLGASIYFRTPVLELLKTALPPTLELVLVSLVMALAISIPGGVLLYKLERRKGEMLADFALVFLLSVPSFLWGIILIVVLGVVYPVLPFMGRIDPSFPVDTITGFLLIDTLLQGQWRAWLDAFQHLILPALALALSFSPIIVRVLRSSLLDTAAAQYVNVARLRGQSEWRVLVHHMLKNAALPTLTLIGVQFGFLFGGTLLIELIFSFPGIGNLMVQAIKNFDLPLIQGVALVFCLMVLVVNFCVDGLYAVLDPRLRTA
ncbi:ABC transporter permease [Pusillimonas noertemannii]|uniref:Peptide/nickel transport system permease protein n=1 Tax=Pusillimonas noertemannii TaxID=305977 RepID=A0A2U1CNE1_9BURK|nr:ABC transporter permease [Pusillimonas noertemannii]NYT68452.1 ABC transporter permease [Pusillimonas noertemannii]PVY62531.1 peptide/nickel transport system permease protein [Pusillimonas noertemannii]TFL10517.1 ABC transporter permease [Pusillimonas noertemannii]